MHPFSVLTLAIFVAGYITARWDLVTRIYDLAIFAWDHGVVVSYCLISHLELPLRLNYVGANGQRICHTLYILLLIHHTGGKACRERS